MIEIFSENGGKLSPILSNDSLAVTNGNGTSHHSTGGSKSLPVTPSNSIIMEDVLTSQGKTSQGGDIRDINIGDSAAMVNNAGDSDSGSSSTARDSGGLDNMAASIVKSHPEDSIRDPVQTFFSSMEIR